MGHVGGAGNLRPGKHFNAHYVQIEPLSRSQLDSQASCDISSRSMLGMGHRNLHERCRLPQRHHSTMKD